MDALIRTRMKRLAFDVKHSENAEDHIKHVRDAWKFVDDMCMKKLDFQISMRFIEYIMKYQ